MSALDRVDVMPILVEDPAGAVSRGGLAWRVWSSASAVAVVALAVQDLVGVRAAPPGTAALALALAVAVLGQGLGLPGSVVRRLASALATVVMALAGVLIAAFIAGFGDAVSSLPSSYSAVALLLIAWGVRGLDSSRYGTVNVGATALVTASFVPMIAILSSMSGIEEMTGRVPLPLASAIMLLLLFAAAVLARPARAPLGALGESGALPMAWAAGLALLVAVAAGGILARWAFLPDSDRARSSLVLIVQVALVGVVMAASIVVANRQQARMRRNQMQTAAERAFRAITTHTEVGFAVVDDTGHIVESNDVLAEFLGVGSAEGLDWDELTAQTGEVTVNGLATRLHFLRPDGRRVWADVIETEGVDGRSMLVQVVDRTEAQGLSEALEWRAGHDDLTGVLSRQALLERLDGLCERDGSEGRAVLLADIDRFHVVADAFPTSVTDRILADAAACMAEAASSTTDIGRMHADAFVVIGPPGSADDPVAFASRVVETLTGIDFGGEGIRVSASAGVTVTRRHATVDAIVGEASAALVAAKAAGLGQVRQYGSDMSSHARERLDLLAELRKLVETDDPDGQMDFWYQPVVGLADRGIVGHEVLARWHHPSRGLLVAGSFMEAAELDIAVTQWIGMRSLRAAKALAESGRLAGRVAVNLSGVQVASARRLTEFADAALEVAKGPGVRLGVEITETVLVNLGPVAIRELHRLVAGDCTLYVDDFGAGYSSIAHLRDLPIGVIKMDREYTEAAMAGGGPLRLARGLASLASVMGIETVAEGIETEDHARVMAEAGWQSGQGWHLGRPAPLG